MRCSLHAEWTKLRTVSSNMWILLTVATGFVGGSAFIATITQPSSTVDTVPILLSGVQVAQLAVIAVAVLAVSPEYQYRLIRTTLAANPHRLVVLAARSVVVAAAVVTAASAGVLGGLITGRAVLLGQGFTTVAPATGPLWRAAVGTVMYLLLVALLSAGVATVVRHAGLAIGAVMAILYGPYLFTLIAPLSEQTLHAVQKAAPMTAGLAVQSAVSGAGTAPIAPWSGLVVLAAYAAFATLAAAVLFTHRDA